MGFGLKNCFSKLFSKVFYHFRGKKQIYYYLPDYANQKFPTIFKCQSFVF